ncbi:N-(5'-phosphoribosyl)anthranilate isomerase [Aestuariicoccus sp. MJ-SS9]|uniref:N-(5'-phosphoribosyl)anthranilate isomerase n=1 Tax=Aestuariicoccus sp. MJ-SS9 TaxID=3079855 RepID=UPI00290CC338|nr:N-(5'-phosphoribosyl)anthranilate isomerase [Aestuariicoccus sp. MJ-SS9]MDU8913190.1 N-(5'-phosphoribosyl)anthranilate isomerase [Aestuariicoccus sp. MJ-SS9]
MTTRPLSPDIWLHDLFATRAVQKGDVLRRKARDIERIVGWEAFCAEVRRRGFRAYRNGAQVVIFCNQDRIERIA